MISGRSALLRLRCKVIENFEILQIFIGNFVWKNDLKSSPLYIVFSLLITARGKSSHFLPGRECHFLKMKYLLTSYCESHSICICK